MTAANRLSPLRFVLVFGVVSGMADVVYEGARAIVGPFLATLGASAVVVGFVTGLGEAVALVLRLGTGRLSDRTGRHWALSIIGYVVTVAAVPPLALAQTLWQAAVLVVAERFGKAVRVPARDTMLAQASSRIGRGRAFALHEALDQSGALVGPLVVAAMVAISGYRLGFGVLVAPAVATLVLLAWLRRAVPTPGDYEDFPREPVSVNPIAAAGQRFSARFWAYTAFTAMTMLGYATFGVLSYHLQIRHVVPEPLIPVLYAVAMGVAALAALAAGASYDRIGLRGLVVLPVLAAAVAFLSYSTSVTLVCLGAVVWGAVLGVHESTMRAAVADLVPAARRGLGYGTFTAVYGLAWLAGGTILGGLYGYSITIVVIFTVLTQALALLLFIPLLRREDSGPTPA